MPWKDGTGPWWIGSRSLGGGWRKSWCTGRGWRGRGAFAPFYGGLPAPSPAEEIIRLEEAARILVLDLADIRERIEALRSK